MTSGYYCFVQFKGDATCFMKAETYAVGDHLEVVLNATTANIVATSGSTALVRTVNSFGVSKASGSTNVTKSIYMYGNLSTDIAAS
jgi:hypothetical protein